MKMMPVKPAKGLVVRDPATGLRLPAHGASVPATPFWRQRHRHGDVADTTEAEIAAGEASATAPPEAVPPEAGKTARKAKE